jgi:ribonuclease R
LAPKYQPVKPRVIAKQLDLASEQHKALKLAIRRLVKAGKLVWLRTLCGPKGQSGAGARAGDRRRGQRQKEASTVRPHHHPTPPPWRQSCHRHLPPHGQGFGFVRPEGRRGDKTGDISSPPAHDGRADRDVVRVRLNSQARNKAGLVRLVGEIIEIVERSTHQFVGTYQERQGVASVQVDGKVFGEPIPVGDPGAKGAAVGDKVVIEMVRFPTHRHPGEAVSSSARRERAGRRYALDHPRIRLARRIP